MVLGVLWLVDKRFSAKYYCAICTANGAYWLVFALQT